MYQLLFNFYLLLLSCSFIECNDPCSYYKNLYTSLNDQYINLNTNFNNYYNKSINQYSKCLEQLEECDFEYQYVDTNSKKFDEKTNGL